MKIHLNVKYRTVFGEVLKVKVIKVSGGESEAAGKSIEGLSAVMRAVDGENWSVSLDVPSAVKSVNYCYSVDRQGRRSRKEWAVVSHQLDLNAQRAASYTVWDRWIDFPDDAYLYSAAFTDCLVQRKTTPSLSVDYACAIRLKVRAPQLRRGERLALTGSGAILGDWDTAKALPLEEHQLNEWVITLNAETFIGKRAEFKFVVFKQNSKVRELWEEGGNRTIDVPEMKVGEVIVYELTKAHFAIYPWKGAGTVIPLFSLRSEGSFGVGDFGDLKMMIDWVASTGQNVLQLLPINDTTVTRTWTDSYPYNCISVFALHPQYIDFRQLPPLLDKEKKKAFEKRRKELNLLPAIDYEGVMAAKMDYIRALFLQEGKRVMASAAYKRFFAANEEWLVPYAAFSLLRDLYGTASFETWPDHRSFTDDDRKAVSAKRSPLGKKAAFWLFLQFLLDKQMRDAHHYARQKGVILKGDIPIGISRDGADAWTLPAYFNMDEQAGAPPDAFAQDGQNWGFPTYNWDVMLADGCQWWVKRLRKMAEYFDAYRIDHVLGFFRIWEIPLPEKSGLMGQFSPALGMTRAEVEAYGLPWREDYLSPPEGTRHKNVLFLRDRKDRRLVHPRIAAQLDDAYGRLSESDKKAFNNLYDDYFYRRNNQFWYHEAMKKLPLLTEATSMLPCAEDLGMVPDCVGGALKELRILSLEIQSMPKDPKERFGHLSRNPYLSVCTISTHDMPTLRQSWDEDKERTQDYYNTMLYRSGDAPHPLPGWLAREIVSRHLTSPSMLCIISLQDWLSISERLRLKDTDGERINIPSEARHYWRYRMHITIEQLSRDKRFNQAVADLVRLRG